MALKQLDDEQITVSASLVKVTSTKLVSTGGVTQGIILINFQHVSGGLIRVNSKTDPAADGSVGFQKSVGDEWQVAGFDDMVNFQMIKETSESDATIMCQFFGAP